jgi:hypothetical protein
MTPLAAALTALAALACCLPLGFAGAAGVLALSTMFDALQPWFLGAAALLLLAGAWQCFRTQRSCQRQASRFSLLVLGLSAAVVLGVLLFPQVIAGLIADYVI